MLALRESASITLTLSELEAMLHEPVRDKRYLDTRLGPSVAAYLSRKENEAGAAERTLDQYERDLARLCVTLANHDIGTSRRTSFGRSVTRSRKAHGSA